MGNKIVRVGASGVPEKETHMVVDGSAVRDGKTLPVKTVLREPGLRGYSPSDVLVGLGGLGEMVGEAERESCVALLPGDRDTSPPDCEEVEVAA